MPTLLVESRNNLETWVRGQAQVRVVQAPVHGDKSTAGLGRHLYRVIGIR